MRTKLILGCLATALALGLMLPAGSQQDETYDDKVRELLQKGIDLYKRGKYKESYATFEEAFQRKPSSDLIYAFLKRAGEDTVASMMNAPDEDIRNTGHRLYALARPGKPIREGKDTVLKYIKDLDSKSFEIYRRAHFHLKNYGAWCLRFVMPLLKNKMDDRLRRRAILLVTEMGWDATLALVEALDSPDSFLRQQAAICLGNVKDDRAIPALKRVYEDPNEKPEVRTLVHEALQKITKIKDSTKWGQATDYYYELAQKYYYSHSSVIHSWERYYLLWKWDTKKDRIQERRVARFAFNEQLAEEALFDLLELDPNYVNGATGESAWSLMVMVSFQEALEASAGIESALMALANDEITQEQFLRMVSELEGYSRDLTQIPIADALNGAGSVNEKRQIIYTYLQKQAKVIRANVMAKIPGRNYVYEALGRSLKDGNHLVGVACVDTIKVMGRPGDLPVPIGAGNGAAKVKAGPKGDPIGYPLIEALTHEDKRVRYAASEAMVVINPQKRKLGMELVIPNLIDALGEQGVRVALVIWDVRDETDLNFINKFKKTLIKLNIFPVIARSGSEGIIKAKQFPTEDVIIIQRKIASQIYFREDHVRNPIVETVFDTLRDDVRTKNIPRILFCRDTAEMQTSKQQYDLTAQGYIAPETHELDLKSLLEKIFDSPEAKKDAKDRADKISRSAAETFAMIDPTNTLYPFRNAVEALIRTAGPEVLREQNIRIPSARALGHFGDTRAIDVLATVLNLDGKPESTPAEHRQKMKPLRWEVGRALSEIYRQTGDSPTQSVYDILKTYTKDGDYDIEIVVGEALGNSTLTNEQRLDLEKHRRIKRSMYTEDDE